MVKILKLLAVLLCLPLAAQSQMASRVMDLGEGFGQEANASPESFLSLHGKVFFVATDSSGREVWGSDGTAAGTELLADSCLDRCLSDPEILGPGGEGFFWVAPWASDKSVLWWSDGTRAGTRALRKGELHVPLSDRGGSFALAGEVLYFKGCLGIDYWTCSPWRTDGTEAGTQPVVPDSHWTAHSESGFQMAGSTLFFAAVEESTGPGIWKSDGTEAGTRLVKSLEVYPRLTAATADRFFFVAQRKVGQGEELWTSDGTEAGTRVLASFPDDPSSSFSSEIRWLKPVGGRVYFAANDVVNGWEIWRTDGTPAGTGRVTSFGFYDPFNRNLEPWQLEEAGSRLVFFATNGIDGYQLWSAAPGQPTTALADVCEELEEDCDLGNSGRRLGKVGGRILFRGVDAAHGPEIWSTDGTVAGTRRLSDICPGPCGGAASEAFVSGPAAWFSAVPHELWKSDGTEAGTRRFVRLDADWLVDDPVVAPLGKKILFSARDGYGSELRVSDGTPEGTELVKDIARDEPGIALQGLAARGNDLFVTACFESYETALFRSGGTPETTAAVFETREPASCGSLLEVAAAAQKVFFRHEGDLWVTDGAPGDAVRLFTRDEENERFLIPTFAEHQGKLYFGISDQRIVALWRSDGTPGGTEKVVEIPEAGGILQMVSVGSELYFTVIDRLGGSSPGLWRSDGTPAGTRRLTATGTFGRDEVLRFVRLGGTVFFAGSTLWKTNGTPEGTERVTSPSAAPRGVRAQSLTVFAGSLYFLAGTEEGEPALWRSNGTAAGTAVVRTFAPEIFYNPLSDSLAVFAGRLFFAADDGVHGRELWTSDGTAAGTALVRDVYPGSQGSQLSEIVAAGGKLYFAADDGFSGWELWESDGTAAGTRLHQDLSPGGSPSSPRNFTLTGSHLFFTADDGVTGRELWALPLQGTGCQPSSTVLCLAGGRFRVEAVWKDFENRTGAGRAVSLTADTGYFWFFDAANVEVVLKVLDGRGVNGHHWVFYGALSSVEYSITVTDTVTGASRRYFNPTGHLGSVGHTEAFGPRGAFSPIVAGAEASPTVTERSAKAGPCVESATRMCLNNGRFAVESTWKDFSGNTGTGKAVKLTNDTGYFWFFDTANVELVLKVLDGRPVNNKFWVFYGALSSVEYTITVTDTETGKTKTYKNPSGRLASVADTTAF
ncbi:MAG TPA: ELWxxDGT repeat protein [Thermoanaerobaculia bacterium]|nr:ELWxxDGT repeat protein [Thermoanaerobaculia bacterium]